MKNYPFSKKAVKAVLAASIALSPLAATGLAAPTSVVAAPSVNVNSEIDTLAERFYQFYQHASATELGKAKVNNLTASNIKAAAGISLTPDKESAFVDLVKNTAALIYSKPSNAADLASKVKAFRTANAVHFNTLFDSGGTVTADQLIVFITDLEPKLEQAVQTYAIQSNVKYSDVLKTAVANTFSSGEHKEYYSDLDGKLSEIGLSVEKLFLMQEKLNNDVIDPASNGKPARSTLMTSAFKEKGAVITNSGNTYSFNVPVNLLGESISIPLTKQVTWTTSDATVATFTNNVLDVKKDGSITVSVLFDGMKIATSNTINVTKPTTGGGGSSSGGSGGSSGGSDGGSTTTPGTGSSSSDVKTDSSKISSNASEVAKAIKDAKDFKNLEITLSNKAEDVTLPTTVLKAIIEKNKEATIDVKTDVGSYSLPASEIDLEGLAAELGGTVEDVNIKITVKVGKDDQDVIGQNKLTAVSDVVEFTVEAIVNGQTKELKTFKDYVSRTIKANKDLDADKSVVLRLEADGTTTAVPTVVNEEEKDEVIVHAMTNSLYVVVENDKTFNDLNGTWNKEQIEKLANKYIVQGRADGSFGPYASTTRVQLAVLLTRALALSTDGTYDDRFKDVKGDEWFVPEMTAAVNAGIIQGKADGSFDPNTPVTRAQAALMINRALEFVSYDKEKELDETLKVEDFKDESKILDWARKDIETVLQAGIMQGRPDGNFDPYAPTTRAQMVKILDETLKTLKFINE